jgi:hypothetical protein
MAEEKKEEGVKILNKKIKGANRHWKNFLDKDYLGSHNLEKGEEMVQKVGGKKDEKTPKQVLYFKEEVPKMILNITNATTIASLYGNHPDQWIGKKIQVYAASVKAFGKTQDALRIRDFIPKREIDIEAYSSKLMDAKSIADLKAIWEKFPASARNDAELIRRKDNLKATLQ